MKNKSTVNLRRRRKTLLGRLPPLEQVLRGSLIERYKRCGKPNCRCAQGQGHGPKFYLSVNRTGARPAMDYVPQSYSDQVAQYLDNYRRVKAIFDELGDVNRELLRRREDF